MKGGPFMFRTPCGGRCCECRSIASNCAQKREKEGEDKGRLGMLNITRERAKVL